MLRRFRPALYILGFALGVGCLLGARALTAGNSDQPKTANPAGTGNTKVGGPVVLGTVDSDPPPIDYRLPAALQSGTVAEVFVKNGSEVAAGAKLYSFDTSLQQRDLERAKAAVKMAETKVADANEAVKQHATKVDVMKKGVKLAETKADLAAKQYNLIRNNLLTFYRADTSIKPDTYETRLQDEPRLFEALSAWNLAKGDWELKKAELAAVEAVNTKLLVSAAEAGVNQAQAEVDKAQTAIDLCTVTAKVGGTIERVTISRGSTMGIGTREPALWLVPGQTRIVRAEVEADFAHRVTQDLIGKEVTVYDNSDPKLTYKGKVIRVGGTFLPKRSAGDGLFSTDTRALEAEVEVPVTPPAGQPPLRVGQRVRVNLGQ